MLISSIHMYKRATLGKMKRATNSMTLQWDIWMLTKSRKPQSINLLEALEEALDNDRNPKLDLRTIKEILLARVETVKDTQATDTIDLSLVWIHVRETSRSQRPAK